MNKSLATNLVALVILLAGYFLSHPVILTVGLFAVSGAITNWLAIHMLFEKVPGLYGSGVIPLHFDEFREAIRKLMMEQFFTEENIERFVTEQATSAMDFSSVIDNMNLDPTFDGLIETIEQSSFGGMLSMIGGAEGLSGLKKPFIDKMKKSLGDIGKSDQIQDALKAGIAKTGAKDKIAKQINQIIERRLNELTPQMVKQIIQDMIRQHLGWLVVWGGVFGGLIGLLTTLL